MALNGFVGLIVGLVGLLLPLMLGALSHPHNLLKRTVQIFSVANSMGHLTTGVIIFGWCSRQMFVNNLPWIQWLWFFDGLSVERVIGRHPAFSLYVHQLDLVSCGVPLRLSRSHLP